MPNNHMDFPPLLPPGLHEMNLSDLRNLCVESQRFAASVSLAPIMACLDRAVHTLVAHEIPGEVWVNGSYLTEKIDPNDVDLSVRLDGPFYDRATVQQRLVLRESIELTNTNKIDGFLQLEWPLGHPYHAIGLENHEYWKKQWGIGRSGIAKGIAVAKLLKRNL